MIASGVDSYENEYIESLNRQLEYLEYINSLSQSIQKNYGLSQDQIPTYRPEKLIEVLYLIY